jgi:hypothetical protein
MEMNSYNKKRSPTLFNLPSLPATFGVELLEKEMELERNCNIRVIEEIVQMYQEAIEHFEYKGDPRYLDYMKRLQKILIKPTVLMELNAEQQKTRSRVNSPRNTLVSKMNRRLSQHFDFTETPSPTKKHSLATPEYESPRTPITPIAPMSRNLNRLVDNHESRSVECAIKAKADVKSQENALEARLANRRQKTKTIPAPAKTEEVEGDKSGGVSPTVNIQEIQKQIEDVMDKFYSEKAMKTAEIRLKYESQIRDLERQWDKKGQGDLIGLVIAQMRVTMEEELRSVCMDLDERRKVELEKVKGLSSVSN